MAINLRQSLRSVAPPTLLSEIEGYTALGMKAEALALCRRALLSKRLDGKLFCGVAESLERFVRQKGRWIKVIEAAYGRLNARERRRARFSLLFWESCLNRNIQVLRLAPRNYLGELAWLELLLVAEAAYASHEWGVLKSISQRLKRASKGVLDEEVRGLMLELGTCFERAEKPVASTS